MSKFSNAKKVLSLVLGLMSSGTFGVSASKVKGGKPKAGVSRSSKGKGSEKNKKNNKKGDGKNNKKGAGANKKMKEHALGADDIRAKRGKGARGNFFVDKDGKIKPLNTYGTLIGGGLLTLTGGYGLGKIGTVSKGDYDKLSEEKTNVEGNFSKLQKEYDVVKKGLGDDGLKEIFEKASDEKTKILEVVKTAWESEKTKKNKNFASGRIAQNIKLAFPAYFDEEALKMNSSDFELHLLCRVVRDTLDGDKDKLVDYKLGNTCKISGGDGKSISFGVSPKDDHKFGWKIEGDYNEFTGGIARGGKSNMSCCGKNLNLRAFSGTFDSARDTILGGALDCKPKWVRDILAGNKDGVISADDCDKVQEFLEESKTVCKGGWWNSYYENVSKCLKGIEKKSGEFQPKGFSKKYSAKTLKQAFSLMCILANLRMFMSFVSAGAGEGNYYGKYSRSGVAVASLSVAATEMDGATPKDAFDFPFGDKIREKIKSIAEGCKGKLPDYGIGQLLDEDKL